MATNGAMVVNVAIKNNANLGGSCSNGIPIPGKDGASAYQIAVMQGFTGSVDEWLLSLKGDMGPDGASAYQVAVMQGFTGSVTDWLLSLKGEAGKDGKDGSAGKSAYEVAVSNGFEGTEVEWLASLKGEPGDVAEVTKESIGLGNVENTADKDKNVLSATKLATERTLSFSGAFTATGDFDGSKDVEFVVDGVDATKLIGTIPWANLPEFTTEGFVQSDFLETDEASPAFIKNKDAVVDLVSPIVEAALLPKLEEVFLPQAEATILPKVEELISKKVEFSGEIISGAFVIADADGNLVCTTEVPESGAASVVAGTTVTIEIVTDGASTIDVPEGVTEHFNLFLNGYLMVENVHYTYANDTITLLGDTTSKGDQFTFISYSGTSNSIGIATAASLGLVKSASGLNKVSVADDGTMYVSSIDMGCLVSSSGTEIILNGGSAN